MKWVFKKFPKESLKVIYSIIFTKFLFGVGLGALIAHYWPVYNWEFYGWLIIIISLILAIPGIYSLFSK